MTPTTESVPPLDSAPADAGRLVLRRTLPAPPERVFAAWTDPELARRWLAPGAMTVETAEIDARVGGAYRIVMRGPDGRTHSPVGTYEEVVPGERLVLTWRWAEAEEVTRVTVELRPVGDGETELTLTHEGFSGAEERDNHAEGWAGCLAKLPRAAATRRGGVVRGLAVALLLLLAATGAPPAAAGIAILVEYVDVPPADTAAFGAAMSGPVRRINEARLERGEIFAWYRYAARFPLGQASPHTDVVVTVFTDFASLEDPAISRGYAGWIHRSEIFEPVPGIRSEEYYGKVAYTHVTVDFLDAGPAGREAFLGAMRERVVPRLQQRADDEVVVNWGLFGRKLPAGSAPGYDYALVSRFDGFANLETPQLTPAEADHLVRSEVWRLVEIVE